MPYARILSIILKNSEKIKWPTGSSIKKSHWRHNLKEIGDSEDSNVDLKVDLI